MAKTATKSLNQRANGKDGQSPTNEQNANRLTDDTHDFVLTDNSVDSGNENLANGHETFLADGITDVEALFTPQAFDEQRLDTLADPDETPEDSTDGTPGSAPDNSGKGSTGEFTSDDNTGSSSERSFTPAAKTPYNAEETVAATAATAAIASAANGSTQSGGGGETVPEENNGPVELDLFGTTTDEDTSKLITQDMLLATYEDADGDVLTAADLTVSGGEIQDNGDGTWTFTPDPDFNGDIEIAFTVSDGEATIPGSGIVRVEAVNDGPVADDVDLGATAEDTSFIITEEALLANASDIDGDALSVTDVSVDAAYGALTDNGDGTWTFAPTADLNADDVPFAFTVSDGTTTDDATAVLDITEVNDGPVADDVDLGATTEDTSFIITEEALLANASDIDGDELSVTDVSVSADYGALTDNGDGTWTFAPTADLNAEDVPFAFTVSDGTTTDDATAVLDITEVNDGPVADDVDLGATAEDTSFIITEEALLANASDIDGDELSVTDVSVDAAYGALTDNGDGTWTFAPTADLNAEDVPFAFTVSDGTTTDDATAVLDITEVNDGPVADDVDLGATAEDTSFIITEAALLANASDIDGDELSVTDVSVDAAYGALTDNGDGTWTFAPTTDLNADDVPFAFTVSDGTTTDDATAVLDITEVNDGPVADDVDLGATAEDTSFIITEEALLANASDIDGDALSVTDVSVDAAYGALTDNGDGTWTFAPTADLNADDVPFAFTVSDGTTTDDATAVLDITEVNDGPVADDVDLGATTEDTSFIITEEALLANASDIDGDELSVTDVSVSADYGALTDNGDGTWTFAPTADLNAEDVPFAFTVSDGTTTDDATAVLDITEVNDGPVADDVDLGATAEDTSFIITEEALLANASDIDGDELSVTDVSVDAAYGALTDNGDGTWTFAPTADLNAEDVPFAFTVSDGTTTDDATAVLDITEVNDGPVADDVDLGATAEDTSFIITEAALLANASDIDGDELSVTDVSVDAAYGALTDNGDGTWTFAPTTDLNADDVPFAFTVSDGTTTDDATAVLDITEVNDGPVADDVDLGATAEDTSFIITEEALLANASDIDGDELSVTDVSVDAAYGALTDNGDGTWTFAPTTDLNADDVPFAFTVSDGTTTDDATAVLDITEVNDGPVADDVDLGATAEDTSFIITEEALLANASDIDGDELSVTDVSVDAAYGALTDNGDGTWTFAPTTDLNADDVPFAFTVSDGTTTDDATAVLDITEVNDGPVADDVDLGATAEDTSFIITEEALLANASDIDGDALSVTDVSVSADYGALTDNGDGTWTFAPTADLNAEDVPFAFTVSDGTTTDDATAVLDITEVNDGPVADDVDLGATAEDTSFIITEEALLANASDIDGDELSVTDVSVDAAYGALTDNGDGTWTFAPTTDLNAEDVPFAFTVSDGTTTDDATAVLDITEVNDGPVADDVDLGATAEDTSFIITEAALLANASDIDGDTLSVTDVSVDAAYGALTDNGDGTWTFAPTTDLNADDVPFAFTVSDGTTTDDATAVLDITEVNDGPVADDVDLGATAEDTSFIITEEALLANASDIDGDELSVTDVSVDAAYGALTDNGDGTWTFAPTADLNADDVPFAFTVSDGTTTDDATAVLDITEVNDGPVADDVDLGATAEDTSFIITEEALLANASDIDGDELSVTDVSVDAAYGALTDNGDGTWTFAPTTDLNADDVPFAFTVSDGTTTDDATAVLDITEVNDGPVADDVDLGATAEDTSFIITEEALLANASDIDGDELSVTDVSVDAAYGALTDNGDGTWTFAPTTDLNADDVPFAFTVSDGTTTDDATAVLDITEVNDGPVADDVDLGATAEDTSFIITEEALLANASDIDGDDLSVTDVSVDAAYGALTDNGDGTWTFAPTTDLNADDVPFAFTVSDGTTTDDATAVLDITEVNDGPVADDVDLGATAEDTSFIITEEALLANASDIDGDTLSVTDVSVDAAYGALTDNGDGTWTFAPTADLNADDVPFAFTVSDGTTTDDATAVLDITEVNDGPVADDVDLGATAEDTSFIITEEALLANASDIDGDTLSVTDVSVDAAYGALTDNGDGTWTFAPTADLNADDVPFAFTVSDGTTTDDATAVLDITEVNDGPVADDVDLGATAEDTSFIITEAALLANASDIDGDELSVTDVSVDAAYGALTDNGDGTWTFAPTTDLNADDVPFAFTVSDGTTTDDATAVLDITEVNDGPVADDVDLGATAEDTSFIITEEALLANASDIDGDDLSVTDVSVDAAYGALTDNGDGTWTFAPTTDLNADDVPFAFTVSDGTTTDDATAVLDITEVNDGPVADDVDLGATAEDTGFIITEEALLANASDIDGDALSVTDVSVDAAYGSLTDNGDGTWTFAPTTDLNADDVPFAFTVSDGTTTDDATAVLDITEVNDGPVADDVDLGATAEDTSFIITEEALLANASDIDGDTLSVTDVSVDAAYGALTDNGDGTWTFAPTADLNADDVPFAFTVSDGTTTDDATAVLDITEVNDGPVADDVDLGATAEDTGFIITEAALLANASDIDGDDLSVTDVSVDAAYGALTDNGDGTWTFAPTADLNADDVPFAFTVSDGTTTDDATAVLDITEVNDGPVADDVDLGATAEDTGFIITEAALLANASDIDGDELSVTDVSVSADYGSLTDNGDGTWTFAPTADLNADDVPFAFTVSDGTTTDDATAVLDITEVNDGPVADDVDLGATAEDTSFIITEEALLANASDIDGDALSVTDVSVDAAYGALTDNGDGTWTFAPTTDLNAEDVPFAFTVSDGTTTDDATAVLDITEVNDGPVADDVDLGATTEDTSFIITEEALLANASDIDGDELSVTDVSVDAAYGALTDNGDGTWTFAPTTDLNAEDVPFAFTVSDGTTTDDATAVLDITEVNDGPVADDVDLGATAEDTSFIITEEALLANASDIDGDTLSVTDVSVDAAYGALTDNGDGTWTFAPTADLNADDVPFAFTVSDGTTTDDATAVLDITEVNDGPVADDVDLGATAEDTGFIITEAALLANASDIDGDDLSVTDVSVDAAYGALTDNGDGTWTFAPTADLNADDVPFAFTVSDGTTTDDATAVLDITEVNDGPVADDVDLGATAEDTGFIITEAALLANASDIDGDELSVTDVSVSADYGSLTDNGDGTWTFAPTADLNADDVPFAFTVSDGTTTDDATAVLDITEVNDGPVADDVDLGATAEDTSFIITEEALLANASDIDGDALSVTDVSVDAAYGALTDNGDGTWTFAPTTDLNAEDVPFAFTVSDGTTTDDATAVLDITEVNDGPVADDVDLGATTEDTSFIITEEALLANASDIDGDELSVTDVSVSADYGALTDNGDGTWTFAPTADLNAEDVPFAFTVSDGTTTDDATAVLDITEVNDGPVADDVDLGATAEDTSFIITEEALLANASDIDGDELSVTDVSVDAAYGALTDNGDGTWTFAPTTDLNADDVPFAFTVSDGTTTDDATAVLDITEVNDGPVADDVDLGATAEDTSFIITEEALLANASDIDGDELSVTDVSVDAAYGALTDNGDGTWTFAPTTDLNADDVPFAFTVSDGTTTDDATAVLDITEVNDGPVADDVDLGATAEDTGFIITEEALLANASDIDGDALSVTDVSVSADYGALTDNGDGTWTFAPTADLNAEDVPFAFTVSDGTTTDDATAVLDITEVNDGPVADDVDLGATAEDTSFIITEEALLANASDIDGDALSVTDVSVDAAYGALADNGDGTWTFAPTTDLNADDVPFAFTVSDGTTTDDATAVLDITEVNDGPVADDVDLGATAEDTSFIITEEALLANASDIDGDELSVTDVSVDAAYGALTDNGDGTWTFAPTTDLNADDVPFAFTVSDGTTTDDATAVLDITEVNDGPVADDVDLGATAEDTSFIITEEALLANASDIDGDDLSVTDVSVDAAYGALTDNGDGTWTFAPTTDLNADDVPFAFTVSDGTTTDDATAVLDITEVNDGPVADDVDLGATAEDTSFIITEEALLANASDIDGDTLSVTDVSVDAAYGALTDNGDGTWTFAPTADLNADDVPFAFTVSDGTTTDDATAVLDITEVNDGPVADDVDLGATAEDTSFIITEEALLANASDIDGDELSVTDVSVDAAYGALTDNGDGTWTFAPTTDLNADDVPFAFTVSDGTTTDDATAVLDITEVNDGPVADDVDLGATAEDTSFIITEEALLANASDIDGDELSVTDVSVDAAYGALTDNGDGTWTFAPTTDLNADDVPFAFTVSDGTTTDDATAVLDITEVNDGPVADDVDLGATAEDTSFIITEEALLANASDIDGDDLSVTDVSVDAAYGALTDNGDGTWTFAPTTDLNADDVPFAFTVSDGTTTDDATAVLDITEVNDGPVADDVDLGATAEDTSFIITEEALLANASDIDGDTLSVTDVSVDAAYGALTDNGDGTWTFAPTADLNADDVPFAFTVSDGTTTDDATAVLDITEVNDGPVADDVDLGATAEDTSFIITEEALLANASDIDGDTLSVTDVSVDAAYGALTDNGDGTWTFAPTADLNADDVPFAFTVSDGTTTDDATAVLDITEVNDGPVADDVDLGATAEDTSFIITEAALLANASDIDGDELSVTDVSVDAAYGALTDNGDGTWTFAPTTDLNADDVPFAFTVSDGTTTDDATAVLDITEVNDGPVADDVDLGATAEDTSFIITEEALLANASDIDGDDLSVTDVSVDAAYGALTDNGDGTWTFAPTTDLNAEDVPFAFTVSDGTTTDDATAVLDITEVNDGPVADDVDLGATAEDTSFIITEEALLANASDIDGDELSVTDVSVDAAYGALTDNGDGTWTFAPTTDLNADDVPFAFTVSDGTTTDDATAVLDITEVNDGPVADDVDLGATAEDTSFIITEEALLANASDIDGDELSVTDVSVDAAYGALTDNGDGTWTFAPTTDLNADDVPFAFTVSDGTTTDDATAVLDITEVNDGPVADDVDLGATAEDTSFIITEEALLANASDIDGDELSVTDVSVDAAYGALTDNGDGTWTFAPTTDLNAEDVPFAFTVSDGTTTDDATAVLDITEVNDGPVADDVDLGATAEDTSFIITEEALLANASDIDGDELSVTDVSVDAAYGALTDNGDGTWTFAPTTDLNADDVPFAFTVSDGTTTDDATAVLDITEVNDGPVADDVDLGATAEDTSFIITEEALLANASDIDGDELSVTDVSVDAAYGALTDNGDGTWTFAPTTDLNADDVPFAFTVSDGTTTDDATAVLDITEVNDGPVADDVDLGATAEDTSFIITEEALLANASDIDGDDLSVTDVSVDAAYGALTDNGDGTWTFAPTTDLNADDVPFAFTVSDGTTTDDATAVLDITEVNDGPVADDVDLGATAEDTSFIITEEALLANASDIDGDELSVTDVSVDAAYGALTDNGDGTWTFAPTTDLNADDVPFAFTVSDGTTTDDATAVLDITEVNDGPVADDVDLGATAEDTSFIITEEALLANASDIDGDELSVTDVSVDAAYGALTDNGDGTWTFAPTTDLNAEDVPFAFTVSDGTTTDDATAVLDITEVNDGPVADDVDLGATAEDTSFIITEEALLANASDIDGDELSVTDVSVDAAYGALTDNGDGTWTFAPTTDLNADDVPFAFTVSDGTTTDDATAVLDITEVNDAPTDIQFLTTQTITTDNYDTVSGVTVTARNVNSDGSLTSASEDNVSYTSTGFGANGAAGDVANQIEYDTEHEVSEELIFDFDADQTSVTVDVDRLYGSEGNGGEEGTWTAYRDGVEVGSGEVDNDSGELTATLEVTASDGGGFDRIVFAAAEFPGGQQGTNGSSDYYVNALTFQGEETLSIKENSTSGTVATLSASDIDDTEFSYEFVDGAGNVITDPNFIIVGNEIQIRGDADIDYEENTVFNLNVRVTDDSGATHTETLTVDVVDVYEADMHFTGNPSLSAGLSDGSVVATATFDAHPGSSSHSFSLVDDSKGAFDINSSTGEITIDGDVDTGSSYTVTVKAQDNNGRTYEEDVTISFGSNGSETISGSEGNDIIYGFDGSDSISAGDGDDIIYAGDAGTSGVSSTIADNDPTGYWRLGETSGTTANDETGTSDGKYNGGVDLGEKGAVEGDTDTSAVFDGKDEYVQITNDSSFESKSGSIQLWFNADSTSNTNMLVNKYSKGSDELKLYISNGTLIGKLGGRGGDVVQVSGISTDDWNHVSMTWDGSELSLYLNGELVDTDASSRGLDGNTGDIFIGADNGYKQFFDGTIDEVAIFDTPLSQSDIEAMYKGGSDEHVDTQNKVDAGDGDDLIVAGSGADHIDGGLGTDTVSYTEADGSVTVDLSEDQNNAGEAEGDTFSSIENVVGSDYGDLLIGNDEANTLTGGLGDDKLAGGDGDDIFIYESGDGSDTVSGGAGWTDAIELTGFDSGSYGTDWTVTITSGEIEGQNGDSLDLSDDAAGTINFDDGSQIDFDQLEQINW